MFSTGYVSDSSAFAHHTVLDKSTHKTKIRRSRITGKPTARNTLMNRLGNKVISELIEDENLIGNVVKNEFGGFSDNTMIVNDVNRNSKASFWHLWKNGERSDLELI